MIGLSYTSSSAPLDAILGTRGSSALLRACTFSDPRVSCCTKPPLYKKCQEALPPPLPPRGGQGCFTIGNETSERVKEQNDVRAVSQVSFLLQATDSLCIPLSFRVLVSLPLVRVLRRAEISIMTETGPRKQRMSRNQVLVSGRNEKNHMPG